MGVFDKASLALVPDGIKDGKLYSIKPTDGSSDFTFNRGSNLAATRVNENGLIEKGRENVLLQSNQFDTTWVAGSNLTVTSGQSDRNGTNTAWLLSKSSSNRFIYQDLTSSGVQTYSVYIKAGTSSWVRLVANTSNFKGAYFDLSNVTTGYIENAIDATIESVGNDWYRCSVIFEGAVTRVRIYPAEQDSTDGTTGSIYIQDAQLEQGLVATDYIETGATTAQAGILEDLPRINYTGSTPSLLLEPSRTNLITQSEYLNGHSKNSFTLVNFSNTTCPIEGVRVSQIIDSNSGGNGRLALFQSISLTASTTYTASIFAKADQLNFIYFSFDGAATSSDKRVWFNLSTGQVGTESGGATGSIESFGNGWYRCIMVFTADNTGVVNTKVAPAETDNNINVDRDGSSSVFATAMQLEQGSYATSYIPTYGATATRGSEQSAFELELAPFFNNVGVSGDATFMMETSIVGRSSQFIDLFSQGGSGNNTYNGTTFGLRIDGGAGIANFGDLPSILTILDSIKILIRKSGTTFNVFVNGTKSTSTQTIDISATPIKWADHVSTYRNSHAVKQILKFPEALSDADCITLTT